MPPARAYMSNSFEHIYWVNHKINTIIIDLSCHYLGLDKTINY